MWYRSTRAQRWAQELSNKDTVKITKQQEEKHIKNIAVKNKKKHQVQRQLHSFSLRGP